MRIWTVLRDRREHNARLDARAREAEREKDVSRERLERVRSDVTGPIQEFGRGNQFAELIRESLLDGYEG